MKVKVVLNQGLRLAKDRLPEILTVISVGGQVTSNILFIRAAKKEAEDGKLSHYILPTAVSAASIGAVVASNRVSNEQKVALVAAGALSVNQFKEYRETVRNNVDVETYEKIQIEYGEKDLERLIIEADEAEELDGEELHRKVLYYFPDLRIMLQCDPDTFNVAILNLNEKLSIYGYASINDLIKRIDKHAIEKSEFLKKYGDDFGWQIDEEDYYAGLTRITINQYTRKVSSGEEVTFVYFMEKPLNREEWEDYYARYFEHNR